MTTSITIPQEVIEKDQKLEVSAERSSEALAKYRWQQTLDPAGPMYKFRAYARAVGRSDALIRKYAKGYDEWVRTNRTHSLTDAMELAALESEKADVAEAVASAEGVPITQVTHRRGASSLANTTETARSRAQRKGTSVVDEAKDIAERRRQTREMTQRQKAQKAEAKSIRFVEIEGHLAYAQRRLQDALQAAQDVGFSDDEMELLRSSLDKIRALLNLLDLRMAGTLNVDWDGELQKITGGAA